MNYSKHLQNLCNKYLFVGYGGNFHRWLADSDNSPDNSWGNGSAMRVAAIGENADSLEDAEKRAELSAICTHNTVEGIRGAKAIAGCVYLAKSGASKREILKYAEQLYPKERCEYYVGRKLEEYRSEYKFEVSCEKSVPVAIQCFMESYSFESCIRNVFFMNGDTDTLGAMAGAIAESFYNNFNFEMKALLKEYLDIELYEIFEAYEKNRMRRSKNSKSSVLF